MIFDKLQKWFADCRVKLHKGTRFYQPPTFKARVNDIAKIALDTNRDVPPQGPLQSTPMLGSLVGGLALAGYGYYVLNYVA